MTRKPITTTALVLALVVSLVSAPVALGAAASGVYDLDADHGLATNESIRTFEQTGSATGEAHRLNMSITIADEARDVGLSRWQHTSYSRVFLQVDYNEEIERTIRIYIPSEYFRPRLKTGHDPITGRAAADFEPANNRSYTAVTITVDGPTTVVYPVSTSRGAVAEWRSGFRDLLENATGVGLPSLTGGGKQWNHVPATELSGQNATYRLPTNETTTSITVQYDADATPTDTRFIAVRQCSESEQPVCTFQPYGKNGTYLLSRENESQAVRWRTGSSATSTIGSVVNDAVEAAEQLGAKIRSLLGGG